MPITYAGVELPVVPAELAAWIEAEYSLADICPLAARLGPGSANPGINLWSQERERDRPIRVGSLYWPRDARRFAVAHFCVTTDILEQLRQRLYGYTYDELASGQTMVPGILSLDESSPQVVGNVGVVTAGNKIETALYMLPPWPLTSIPSDGVAEQLWLLTLVDARFFWRWNLKRLIETSWDPGFQTWDSYYEHFAERVYGLSTLVTDSASLFAGQRTGFDWDEVHADYLFPSPALAATYAEEAGWYLDVIAHNVGQRIVRRLDGSVKAMSVDSSNDLLGENLRLPGLDVYAQDCVLAAGGLFGNAANRLDYRDFLALIPSSFLLACRAVSPDVPLLTPFGGIVDVLPAEIPGLEGMYGAGAPRIVYEEFQLRDDWQVKNYETAEVLALRIFRDWLVYLTSPVDLKLRGLVPWQPEGLSDSIEWVMRPGECYTRIRRPPFDDMLTRMYHSDGLDLYDARGEQARFLTQVGFRTGFATGHPYTYIGYQLQAAQEVRLPAYSYLSCPLVSWFEPCRELTLFTRPGHLGDDTLIGIEPPSAEPPPDSDLPPDDDDGGGGGGGGGGVIIEE
jgi:hypothetical protein